MDPLKRGFQVNPPNRLHSDNGRHALHEAASRRKLSVISELLKGGADPDDAAHQGFRPLHVAAQKGFVEVVQLLKEAGAKLEAQTKTGLQAVHLAAGQGHVPVLKQLQSYHCNLAAPDSASATPLHHAAHHGRLEAVEWLIDAGVSLHLKDGRGKSAAARAEENKHLVIARVLTAATKRASKPKPSLKQQASHPGSTQGQPKLPRVSSKTSDLSVDSPSSPHSSPHVFLSSPSPFTSHHFSQNPHAISTSPMQPWPLAAPEITASSQHSASICIQSTLPPQSPASPIAQNKQPPKSPTQLRKSGDIYPSALEQENSKDTLILLSPHSSPKFPKSPSISTNLSPSSFSSSKTDLHVTQPLPSEVHPPSTPISSSDTPSSSPAQSDHSPCPTTPPSNNFPLPNEGIKPKEEDEKKKNKKVNRNLPRIFKRKTSQEKKVAKEEDEDKIQLKQLLEEIDRLRRILESMPVATTSRDNVGLRNLSADSKEREGCGLGHGGGNVSDDPHHGQTKEAAVMDLHVKPAKPPFPDGPDVYPCYTNPRGLVLILNNKSFRDHPNLTRYGSECDSINLENVCHQMGYKVETRYDLTRQDTLDFFQTAGKSPILKNVSCLFVFILSHGDGSRTFLTQENDKVTLDEVQSCFLDQSSPNLRGKPKFFFSHFCRGSDEEIRPALSPDAKREAYRDMLCLYSATEGFQAYRHGRLGTPSVRALCQTLALYANCKSLSDVIKEFQRLYETMEGATTPEVQNFTFDKDFFLNPIGKSHY